MNIPFSQREGCVIVAVLTEYDVRNILKKECLTEMIIAKGTIVTPSAKSFLNDKGITILFEKDEAAQVEVEICEEEVSETHEVPQFSGDHFLLKKNSIQWTLLKIEFIKFQKSLTEVENSHLNDPLHLILKMIDDVVSGLGQSSWLNTNYLTLEEESKEVELSIELEDYQLELYRLMLLTKKRCCELVECHKDGFGICQREDLLELEVRFPEYIKSLINS